MDLRAERGAATRTLVLTTATRLFAEKGYSEVSIETLLIACGLSKGALYHHFKSKYAVFEAVLYEVETRIVETVASQSKTASNPLDALRAGCQAWLHLVAADPAVRRIAVIDAPAVLGWHAWREIEKRYALGLLQTVLAAAATLGCLNAQHVNVCASLLLACLNEMAMHIARASNRDQAIEEASHAIELLISRFIGVEPGAPWSSRANNPPVPRA